MKISSINNEKVIFWAKLKMKKYRDIEHLFIAESDHLVGEALSKGIVTEIITTEEKEYNVLTYHVTPEVMKRITELVSIPKTIAVCKYITPSDITGNVLILDRIQDPGNFGTMIRSAVAFGFKTIIVSPDTVDMYNSKVIRASEGMLFKVNIIKDNLYSMIPYIKEKGYKIIGTDVVKGKNVKEFKNGLNAIIIGNEGSGLSLELKELCDDFIYIPINKECESLNAAVAASIIMEGICND